jgi:hypothetical protein
MGGGDPVAAQLSADGRWWWNGQEWVAAESADGLWHWDGTEWWTSVPLDEPDTGELARSLARLADERFSLAGAILARRRREWRPAEELEALVDQAHAELLRLDSVEAQLARLEHRLSRDRVSQVAAFLLRAPMERALLNAERERLQRRLHEELIEIGARATRPSVKEADDIAAGARLLSERAAALADADAAMTRARQAKVERVAAAEAELASAEEQHEAALRAADEEVGRAAAIQSEAVEAARHELGRERIRDAGQRLASFDSVELYERSIRTPDGIGPVEGAWAAVGTAAALWTAHQPVLASLLSINASGAEAFHEAESGGGDGLFLLVATDLAKTVVPCPQGQEDSAVAFARTVEKTAAELRAARPEREARLAALTAELSARRQDRSAVQQAEARKTRIETDKRLLSAIRAAREKVEAMRADDAEIRRAQARVDTLVAIVATPPEPLIPARAAAPELHQEIEEVEPAER